jgi:hypothetical protein
MRDATRPQQASGRCASSLIVAGAEVAQQLPAVGRREGARNGRIPLDKAVGEGQLRPATSSPASW